MIPIFHNQGFEVKNRTRGALRFYTQATEIYLEMILQKLPITLISEPPGRQLKNILFENPP